MRSTPAIPRCSSLPCLHEWLARILLFLALVLLLPLVLVTSQGTRQPSGLASYATAYATRVPVTPTQVNQALVRMPMTTPLTLVRTTQVSRGYLLEQRPTLRHHLPPAPTWAPPSRPKPVPTPAAQPAPKSAPRPASKPAPKPKPVSIPDMIYAAFGSRYGGEALRVARCESGLNPYARSRVSTAKGLFQFLDTTWQETPYRRYSPYNAWANIQAAHWLFVRDGYSWREWQCQP